MPWTAILARALHDKEQKPFMPLRSNSDFIDGFEMTVPDDISAGHLQRMLKEHGLDVLQPLGKNRRGCFWVTFRSGPFTLEHNLPLLETEVDSVRRLDPPGHPAEGIAVLQKLDSSRDIAGFFYAPTDWKGKLQLLAEEL